MADQKTPKTLQQAIIYFSDPKNCLDYLVARRWPDGVECPTCGRKDVTFLEKQNKWQCKSSHQRRQFSVKVGTIFEDSPLGLDKWLTAVWMITNCKNGVSSYEIHRAIGVTQKTAWFMEHRIRLAMQTGSFAKQLCGRSKLMKHSSAVSLATCTVANALARFTALAVLARSPLWDCSNGIAKSERWLCRIRSVRPLRLKLKTTSKQDRLCTRMVCFL